MGVLERVRAAMPATVAANGTKTFEQPPFWSLESARYSFWNASTLHEERIENDYEAYVAGAYKSDGIVFSCIDRRQQVFSQARFQWREYRNGRPGELFGTPELELLENPWPNGTTGQLLTLMELDASLAGNFYATTVDEAGGIGRAATGRGRRIVRMRPDWMILVIDAPSGDPFSVDARVISYLYQPRHIGYGATASESVTLLPSEVCHYAPKPDPVARFRGMSWLTPILTEIESDRAATAHKLAFFRNGATPSLVVKGIKAATTQQFNDIVDSMEDKHAGVDNAYRTLYLVDGADATAIGADLKQLDFKATQGAGETRVAAAAGVPAAILGISEGLAGSSLNAGNFGAARRLFVDTTIQDLWGKAAPSLGSLVKSPVKVPSAVLTVDDRHIPFLREDAKDDAEIRSLEAQVLRQLTDAGWEPDAVVDYVKTGDVDRLKSHHGGLFSVQLQPPGTTAEPAPTPAPTPKPPKSEES